MNRRELLRLGVAAGAASLGRWAAPAPQAGAEPGPGTALPAPELRLNWNENPLGPSPSAYQAALAALEDAHRYPDPQRDRLIAALAARNEVDEDHVVLGAGSTDVLRMTVHAAACPGASLLLAEPTFEAVLRYRQPLAYRVERVPLDADFGHDLGAMRDRVGTGRPAVVYLCNPNNPTATLTPSAAIDAWIAEAPETVLFLVDEAYHEYVQAPGYWSAAKWVRERPNVVVTRTFSKIYALAGMRIGYALAHAGTAQRLREFMSIDNANGPALAAALASLADEDLVPRSRAANAKAKRIVSDCLEDLGLGVLPSHTNFVMHRVEGDLDLYIRRMREAGIRVGRPFPPLLGYSRLSMGRPEEMERFAETLRGFRRKDWI